MAFKTRRQTRYGKLIKGGFCKFEARELSYMPINVSYWKKMKTARKKRFLDFMATKGATRTAWRKLILAEYDNNKWLRRTKVGREFRDPWMMIKKFKEDYKAKFPQYESPWEKKARDKAGFQAKLKRTYEKYPRRQPVAKLVYRETGGADIVKE